MKHIMLLFLSDLRAEGLQTPKKYDIPGLSSNPVACRQTNESAVLYMASMLSQQEPPQQLAQIFMITTKQVKERVKDKNGHVVDDERSPLKIFEDAVVAEFPYLSDLSKHFTAIPYESEDIHQCLLDVADMADQIRSFCRAFPGEEFMLHADMTGGFRHASMMMMAIMQLLTYTDSRDIKIRVGQVLYSLVTENRGKIEDATEIHRMYHLLSGVDAFARFGSVEGIREYFADGAREPSPEGNKLLQAMQSFSDAIRLCQVDMVMRVAKELSTALHDFSANTGAALGEKLFEKILDRVRAEYALVLRNDVTELDIIDWCMKRELWQQAATFSFELLPLYIVRQVILAPRAEDEKIFKKDKNHPRWEQNFIVTSQAPGVYDKTSEEKKPYQAFVSFLEQGIAPDEEEALKVSRTNLLADINDAAEIIAEMRAEIATREKEAEKREQFIKAYPEALEEKHRSFSRLLRFLYYVSDITASYDHFLKNTVSREYILEKLASVKQERCLPGDALSDLLCVWGREKLVKKEKTEDLSVEENNKRKWQARKDYWQQALKEERVNTKYPEQKEKILDLLEAFEALRQLRHTLNHASGKNFSKTSSESMQGMKLEVKTAIERCLRYIRQIEGNEAIS